MGNYLKTLLKFDKCQIILLGSLNFLRQSILIFSQILGMNNK